MSPYMYFRLSGLALPLPRRYHPYPRHPIAVALQVYLHQGLNPDRIFLSSFQDFPVFFSFRARIP